MIRGLNEKPLRLKKTLLIQTILYFIVLKSLVEPLGVGEIKDANFEDKY